MPTLRSRLGLLRQLRGTGEGALFARICVVAAGVPLLVRLPLPRLAGLLGRPVRGADPHPPAPARLVVLAQSAGRPVIRPGCLTRGVTLLWVLRRRGLDVELCFGLDAAGPARRPLLARARRRADPRAHRPSGPLRRAVPHRASPGMSSSTAIPAAAIRGYDIYGLALDLVCTEAAGPAADAIDLRLSGFRAPAPRPADLRLELAAPAFAPDPPSGRPVYETPGGTILYRADDDTLSGAIDGVVLRGEPARGRMRIESARYAGRRLYVASHPLATVGLVELLKRHARFNLHAACLARGGRGVLLAGPSGAGKSTLAFGLAGLGLDFLGDDTVFLARRDDRTLRVLGFPDAVA